MNLRTALFGRLTMAEYNEVLHGFEFLGDMAEETRGWTRFSFNLEIQWLSLKVYLYDQRQEWLASRRTRP